MCVCVVCVYVYLCVHIRVCVFYDMDNLTSTYPPLASLGPCTHLQPLPTDQEPDLEIWLPFNVTSPVNISSLFVYLLPIPLPGNNGFMDTSTMWKLMLTVYGSAKNQVANMFAYPGYMGDLACDYPYPRVEFIQGTGAFSLEAGR